MHATDRKPDIPATHRCKLDAQFYPHIVDEILAEAVTRSPVTSRAVCKNWSKIVDSWAAQHVELALHAPFLKLSPRRKWMQEDDPTIRESYGWVVRSALLPVMYLQQEQCFRLPRPEISAFPWVNVRREARMLDIRSAMDFVKDKQSVNDFEALDTVRFVQHHREAAGFDAVHMLPHVPRIIFSDGPYERPFCVVPVDRTGCSDSDCTRPHTRRIVINALDTITRSDGEPSMRFPPSLEELVAVFHGWGIVSGWAEHGYRGGDPVNVVRGPIVRALLEGVRVTVVNSLLADLEDGGRRSNVERVRESLEYFIDIDLVEGQGWAAEDVKPLLDTIEWLTLEEFRHKIGDEQYEIETMTDKAAQRKKYMCLVEREPHQEWEYSIDGSVGSPSSSAALPSP